MPHRRLPPSWLTAALLCNGLFGACAISPEPDLAELHRQVSARLLSFEGDVSVYLRRLGHPQTLAIRADEPFPTASMIKIPIALALLQRVAGGQLDLDQKLVYKKSRAYPGEDMLASFDEGTRISLRKLLALMLAFSDNTASLWCQELAGTGTTINAWLQEKGLVHTRVNSRTPGRERAFKTHGWGQTSAREMAELLVRIHQGRAVTPDLDTRLERELCKSHWDAEALSALPPTVQAASKQGAVSHSRSEVVLVHAPGGAYVFCVITKNQRDRSWRADNQGYRLLRDLSALFWRHCGGSQAPE